MNRHYLAGRRWEYEICKRLKNDGWSVVRSAGSKGLWDVTGLRDDKGLLEDGVAVILIQAKRGASRWQDANWARLKAKARRLPDFVLVQAWVKRPDGTEEIHNAR